MFHATTIIAVRHQGKTAFAGDGQVTFGGNTIMKHHARKVRTLYHGKVLAGFAGSVADAFTLFEKFESKLEEFHGNMMRAAVVTARLSNLTTVLPLSAPAVPTPWPQRGRLSAIQHCRQRKLPVRLC